MAAPVVDDFPGGKSSPVDALMQVEDAIRVLDAAMPPSRFKSRIVRSLVLWLCEAKYQRTRRPSARRHLWSHRLVK